ncbi:glycosyltransferase family 2 protein [Oceanidesulfovibrio marinus]|uniref:Glycosyltransferase family 2 protein n=1 Tax=Oceanidesulfovibrio marinus TaxID=370038 RepID=A0ABX6NBR4_9BACT|nr:glycosyltransferase family 2 protein [Oceanidesulfovibrio marinus]QJT07614.1 glycosyltransferase family 2 protein [Oceanidesulfovibrio marinus]
MLPFPLKLASFAALDVTIPMWRLGVEGSLGQNLIHLASDHVAGDPNVLPFLVGMLDWSWQRAPLDVTLLGPYLSLDGAAFQLPPPARVTARALHKFMPGPESVDTEFWEDLYGMPEEELRAAVQKRSRETGAPAYCGIAFNRLLDAGAWDESRALLADFSGLPAPVRTRLEAEWAFHALPPAESRPYIEAVEPAIFGLWRAHCLARLTQTEGGADEAMAAYAALWREIPWHTNLALMLHDLLSPPPPPNADDREAAGRSAILLYSWNKADVLDTALSRLKETELCGARVIVLDNGATDATPQVLARHRDSWPGGRFQIETLPVNIGAPAARNWLLSMPELADVPAVAFLDDDALPEHDTWLATLMAALRQHPDVSAVGCHVTDHTPPYRCQAADFHLHPTEACGSQFADMEENIHPADNCLREREMGLFEYSRSCCHVTGCCHLIPRESLDAVGFFDIRFNPSQFDDLERDLRSCAAGRPAFYTGHVAVRHMQHSSMAQADDPAKSAHIHGNKIKLEGLFSKDSVKAIVHADQQAMRSDLLAKLGRLISTFGENR